MRTNRIEDMQRATEIVQDASLETDRLLEGKTHGKTNGKSNHQNRVSPRRVHGVLMIDGEWAAIKAAAKEREMDTSSFIRRLWRNWNAKRWVLDSLPPDTGDKK